jgi:hypothetical protein
VGATIGKGLPRFRAGPNDGDGRFCETTTLTADVPSSISAIRCAVWAAVHFGYHAHHVSQSDGSGFVPIATARRRQRAFSGVSPPATFGLWKACEARRRPAGAGCARFRRECPRVARCICAGVRQGLRCCRDARRAVRRKSWNCACALCGAKAS